MSTVRYKNMKKKKLFTITTIIVVAAVAIAAWLLYSGRKELQLHTRILAEGTVENTVMSTGYIQPVEEVEVGTQVSGIIDTIYVDYNTTVKKGHLLAVLETQTLEERVSQARATVNSAESELNYARQNYNRIKELYYVKAATLVSYEDAVNKLTQAETSLENANANLHQAEVNLSYAYIYSPINGVILNRAVNIGQTVAASFNTPTLFTIAEDLTRMQVEADVDEADIGQVKLGQHVTFTVDAFNDMFFEGTVSQIRLQPIVTNNVVTYTVIIEAPNPEKKLFPGMTANITIITASETGLVIPVEALNFRMTPEIRKKLHVNEDVSPLSLEESSHTIWVKTANGAKSVQVTTGISDGVNTLVESGVSAGEEAILSASYEKKKKEQGAAANPLMPQRPRRR